MKIILIGPRYNGIPKTLGGTIVSFKFLTEFAQEKKMEYKVIYINQYSGSSFVKNSLHVYIQVLKNIRWSDVIMLNISERGFKYLAVPVFVFSKIFRKKIAVRVFGGNIKDAYLKWNWLTKLTARKTVLQSDLFILQSKELIKYFTPLAKKIYWLPTSRPKPEIQRDLSVKYSKRFVFISQIRNEKGVDVILECFKKLPADYSIDFYGPILDDKYSKILADRYKGFLDSSDVPRIMSQYDVLCFPTFWEGEGYPGVIIEAYSCGIPVIASNWLQIPEIVEQNVSGLLVEPNSIESLENAVLSINEFNYNQLALGARNKFNDFSNEDVYTKLLTELNNI